MRSILPLYVRLVCTLKIKTSKSKRSGYESVMLIHFEMNMSVPWLMMPSFLVSPCHKPTWYRLCRLNMFFYPMLRADSRFWLVNNREIWSRISRLTSSAWDIKTKERHWWRHNGDSDRRPLSLPLRYDLVTLCLYDDLGQINVIAGI